MTNMDPGLPFNDGEEGGDTGSVVIDPNADGGLNISLPAGGDTDIRPRSTSLPNAGGGPDINLEPRPRSNSLPSGPGADLEEILSDAE